eukprot:gene14080-5067_t
MEQENFECIETMPSRRARRNSFRRTLIRRNDTLAVPERRRPVHGLGKSSRTYPVHFAAMTGNLKEIERLVKSDIIKKVISSIDQDEMTPLHYAARNDDCYMASTLLTHGAILDCITKRGTPLQIAMRYRKADVCFLLLRNGADVELQDHDGMNALHLAADNSLSDVALKLVASFMVDVNSKDSQMNTALHYAAINGSVAICKTLLEYGATAYLCNHSKETALHLAAAENNLEIITALLNIDFSSTPVTKIAFLNMKRNDEKTALLLAFRMGHLEIAKLLIEHGADLQAEASGNKTALHFAAKSGNVEVVTFLMEHMFPTDVQDKKKRTPAIYNGNSEVARLLLTKGASVNVRDCLGTTPLLLAVEKGNHTLVLSLLESGAVSSDQDNKLKTGLHYAIEKESFQLVNLLLDDCKELISKKDEENRSPLHYAAESGCAEILKYIVERTMQLNKTNNFGEAPLHIAASLGHVDCIEILANDRNGESINFRNREGQTPLHLAVIHNKPSVCLALLERNAAVDPIDSNNWTPLQYASFYNNVEIVRILLQCEASLNYADCWGSTPLMIAAEAGNSDTVILLLEAGASVVATNEDGDNFFDLALDCHRESVVQKILESSRWRQAISSKDANGSHFMTKLIERYPSAAEIVLNRSTSFSDHHPEHPDFTVTFDYVFLEEVPGSLSIGADFVKIFSKNHGVPYFAPKLMSKFGREQLMQHPIITSLLSLKWERLCRYFYYSRFFVYLVFNVFLNVIVVLERKTQNRIDISKAKLNRTNESFTGLESDLPSANSYGRIMGFVVLTFAFLQLLNEAMKMYCRRASGNCFAVYIPGLDKPPTLHASASFLQFTGFQSTNAVIVKILVMMTGEFDFSNWLAGSKNTEIDNYAVLPYPEMTYLVFVLFLLLVTVAFTNLLIGLAVGDIEKIRSSAKMHIVKQQLQLIESIQMVVPKYLLKKYIQKRKIAYKINKKSKLQRLIEELTSDTRDQELKRLRMTQIDFESYKTVYEDYT